MGLEEAETKTYTCSKNHTWEAVGTYLQGIFVAEKYQDICPECKEEGCEL